MPAFASISKRLKANQPQPPGRFSFGTQLQGGPRTTDAFGAQRAPSLTQLVENYHAIVYAMVARNRNAVARLPMRLLADGSRVQGKPSRACDPIKVSRAVGVKLAESGQISTAAIDQVYEIRNHPILDVLDNPDPYGTFTREQLIGLMVSYMDVVGSAFLVPEGNGWDWRNPSKRQKGPPDALWVLYPQYAIPVRQGISPIVDHFQYFSDWLPLDSVLWLRHNHSLRDAYGSTFSPTYAGEPYRKQEQEQVAILSQVLGLGPRPNMIASAKDPLMAPGRDEAQALWEDMQRMQAGGNAGGLLVNTGGFDFTPISYPPADLGNKEIALQDIYILASIFDQPQTYYTVDSNLANLEAARKEHYDNGIEPRCKAIAGIFTRWVKTFDPRLMFQFDPGLPEDEIARAQCDKIYLEAGAITINELNEEKKYPKKPYGDEPLIDKNKLPLSMIISQAQSSMDMQKQQIESGEQQDVLAAKGQKHDHDMDKKGHELNKAKLKLDGKKVEQAGKKPSQNGKPPQRSIEAEVESVLLDIQTELMALRAG